MKTAGSAISAFFSLILLLGCMGTEREKPSPAAVAEPSPSVELVILGNLQDGGSPHIGCSRDCCKVLWQNPDASRKVVSLGLIDRTTRKSYLFEATPDLGSQLQKLIHYAGFGSGRHTDGIFLTHAHIGHYSGLMFLGREALNASGIAVFAMPGMQRFLRENGPWNQLVELENIVLQPLYNQQPQLLSDELMVIPFRVPHRDEYSETVGFEIRGPQKSLLFIPDIDKWDRWEVSIAEKLKSVDLAFVDATFYDAAELGYRDMAEIPHPFVVESRKLLDGLPAAERDKIHFIHFNHTNPLLDPQSSASRTIEAAGYHIAREGQKFAL
ncbi:MBL fold metallo-hydrolase [Robiginitalea sp. IMCC43444]|uniref:MBL fold metallo-hydrolase n=1 Tax=Robiginitalea sp. IMCC43444 TaxID=3459121 RepID=UPI004043376B